MTFDAFTASLCELASIWAVNSTVEGFESFLDRTLCAVTYEKEACKEDTKGKAAQVALLTHSSLGAPVTHEATGITRWRLKSESGNPKWVNEKPVGRGPLSDEEDAVSCL